jgi:hypothetical protein
MMQARLGFLVLLLSMLGCASQWKIQGGPPECVQMCRKWNMELTGMVGVGNQDATGPGATACVCQVKRAAGAAADAELAASGTAASSAAVIVAIEEEQRRQAEQSQKK